MKTIKSLLGVAVFLCLWISSPVFGQETGMSKLAQRLTLPDGDVEAGRIAFQELKCNTCHEIKGDNSMPPPSAEPKGPVLGARLNEYPEGFIADSIIFPSHAIKPGSKGRVEGTSLSRMGDFSESMTVRQLVDIVTYLKALDEEV